MSDQSDQQWQQIYTTLRNSANTLPGNFVPTLLQGVQALANGSTDQVCLVRVGNQLTVQWEPSAVRPER